MDMLLFEIYEGIAKVSDALANNEIEFKYDALMGVMGCHPADALEMVLPNIDWDSRSPDMDKISEALDELIEFNEAYHVDALYPHIEKLRAYIEENK